MNLKLKAISLSDLEADGKYSVWVLNKTNPRGIVNISMPDNLGGTVVMIIPITWIPIDLTTQTTREGLLKSPVMRRLITSGSLMLISEEDALKVMESPEAKEEAKRVYSVVQNEPTLESQEVKKLMDEEKGKVGPYAMNVISLEGELEEDKIYSMIRGQEGILTEEDYSYISLNSKYAKVKEYCANMVVALKEEAAA